MTLIAQPVTVEVHAQPGCDAAAATIGYLRGHGIEPVISAWGTQRPGYFISPTVTVWVGEGDQRHIRLSWSGPRDAMLATTVQLHNAQHKETAA